MDVDDYRQLRLLAEISSSETITQRRLAKKHGLALGLTNFLIRRLIKKGYVKIVNLERKRLRYLITPKGVAEKARLTYDYLDYSLALYRHMRTLMTDTLAQMERAGGRRVVIYGTGELAEITLLAMQERGLEVVAVLEESDNGRTTFMNRPICSLAALPGLDFDWVVIATFKDPRRILHQLHHLGVSPTKIATIPPRSALGRLDVQTAVLGSPEALVEARSG